MIIKHNIVIIFILVPFMANAACDPGYYIDNAECVRCHNGFYCPDGEREIPCPDDTTDWATVFTEQGYVIELVQKVGLLSWYTAGEPARFLQNCHCCVHVHTSTGIFYYEPAFTGSGGTYDKNSKKLWYSALPGYYLSPYYSTSYKDWYSGTKPCTNAPQYAHYTGAGTPDATNGSIIDANDCPWECDDGRGRHDNECVPLCSAGIQQIKTGTGLSFNLYPVAYSEPALHINYNGQMCYGVLGPGIGSKTLNMQYSGRFFHMKN